MRAQAAATPATAQDSARGATERLKPKATTEQVTVTAYRLPLGSLESPVTTQVLAVGVGLALLVTLLVRRRRRWF